MNRNLYLVLALPGFAISTTAAAPQSTESAAEIDLAAAVELALQHSPAMRSAQAALDAAEAAEGEARGSYLPNLQLKETLTRSDNPVFAFGSKLEQGRFDSADFELEALNRPEPLTNLRSNIELHARLLDLSRRPQQISAAAAGALSARAGQTAMEQHVRFATIAAYLGVLSARGGLESAAASLETASSEARRLAELHHEGLLVESDLLSAQVIEARYQQEWIAARGALRVAEARLADVLGLRPAPRVADTPWIDPQLPALDEVQLFQAAEQQHPTLQQRRSDLAAAEAARRHALLELTPSLDGFAQWGYSSDGLSAGSDDYAIGLALVWDLFDPGRADRRARAAAVVRRAAAERDAALSQVETALAEAVADQASAQAQLEVAARAEGQADRALAIVRERHAAGLSTISELLAAQSALGDARQRRRLARHGALLGYARALLAAGQLEDIGPITDALRGAP